MVKWRNNAVIAIKRLYLEIISKNDIHEYYSGIVFGETDHVWNRLYKICLCWMR